MTVADGVSLSRLALAAAFVVTRGAMPRLALIAAALYRAFPFGRAEHTARLEALRMQALDSERIDPVP